MSKKIDGTFCYSLDGDSYTGTYATREEAIREGNQYAYDMEHETFFIGECYQSFFPSVDANLIIENIVDNAISECGDHAEDYLEDIPGEIIVELEEKMNEVLNAWIEKYGYSPHFYSVKNKEQIDVIE